MNYNTAFGVLFVLMVASAPASADSVLITGANSGIGLEFARQYAADGWDVIATHRRSSTPDSLAALQKQYDNVRIERIDVTDPGMIAAAASKLEDVPIDILINNAGIVGTFDDERQHFGSFDFELFEQFMAVNTAGPLRVSQAFYPNVAASKQKKIVAISSAAGSFAMVRRGIEENIPIVKRYWYNMSKAALNMAFMQLAASTAEDGVSVAVYHPGLVRVERTASYQLPEAFKAMSLDVDVAVGALRERFAELNAAASGGFYAFDGNAMPW